MGEVGVVREDGGEKHEEPYDGGDQSVEEVSSTAATCEFVSVVKSGWTVTAVLVNGKYGPSPLVGVNH